MVAKRSAPSCGLFWQIQRQKAFFGIRLFKIARLKHLRKLGPKDRLVEYAPTDRKWRKEALPRSITLRVIDYQIRGFCPAAVVTNILDPTVTSREDWVRLNSESEPGRRLGPGLYHRRWEIETSLSELKIVQELKGRLRSRTPEAMAFEIAGHVLLYLLVRWMMVEAAVKHGCDPLRISFTYALRELHDLREKLITSSPSHVRYVLLPRLLARVASHLVPLRPGRHYPRPNDTKPKNTGKGNIRLPHKLSKKRTQRKDTRTRCCSKGQCHWAMPTHPCKGANPDSQNDLFSRANASLPGSQPRSGELPLRSAAWLSLQKSLYVSHKLEKHNGLAPLQGWQCPPYPASSEVHGRPGRCSLFRQAGPGNEPIMRLPKLPTFLFLVRPSVWLRPTAAASLSASLRRDLHGLGHGQSESDDGEDY